MRKPLGQAMVEAKGLVRGESGPCCFRMTLPTGSRWRPPTSCRLVIARLPPRAEVFSTSRDHAPKLSSSSNWKTELTLPEDNFMVEFKGAEGGWTPPGTKKPKETQWTKFTVLMDDLTTVYFQNGKRLKFHYDFGTKFVPEFDDMTHMQFDSVTLSTPVAGL